MADDELRKLLEAMRQENAAAHAETPEVTAERLEGRFGLRRIRALEESVADLQARVKRLETSAH